MTKITILCVNYHSDCYRDEYIKSIDTAAKRVTGKAEVKVLVAENDTTNRGYFGGIRYLMDNNDVSDNDFIIISNVDLVLCEDFFEELLRLHLQPDTKCIAPSIQSIKEKQERNPEYEKRPSKMRIYMAKMIYLHPILQHLYERLIYHKRTPKQTPSQTKAIYAAHGSILIFAGYEPAHSIVRQFKPFLYGEELYTAEELRRQGYTTWFCPTLRVTDYDHVSTSQLPNRFLCKCHREGLGFVLQNYD